MSAIDIDFVPERLSPVRVQGLERLTGQLIHRTSSSQAEGSSEVSMQYPSPSRVPCQPSQVGLRLCSGWDGHKQALFAESLIGWPQRIEACFRLSSPSPPAV